MRREPRRGWGCEAGSLAALRQREQREFRVTILQLEIFVLSSHKSQQRFHTLPEDADVV